MASHRFFIKGYLLKQVWQVPFNKKIQRNALDFNYLLR